MAGNDTLLAMLAIGGLGIGAIMFLPQLMKSRDEPSFDEAERYLEQAEKLREIQRRAEALDPDRGPIPINARDLDYHPTRRIPLMIGQPEDDAYIITDEDFKRLDIGKKDRRYLNKNRKIRDAQLERVVYGDELDRGYAVPVGSYFSNTVSPYGQGPANEFTRLPGASDLSRVNTKGNTINLY